MKKKNLPAITEEVLNSREYQSVYKKTRTKEILFNVFTILLFVFGMVYVVSPIDALPGPLDDALLAFMVTVIIIVMQSLKHKAKKRMNLDVDELMRTCGQ